MVSTATIMGVGKQNVFMLVIANPVAATFGFGQVLCFAAQPAARFFFHYFLSCF
jgi:hypothetical protein